MRRLQRFQVNDQAFCVLCLSFHKGHDFGILGHRGYPYLYEFQLLNICYEIVVGERGEIERERELGGKIMNKNMDKDQ